MANQVYINGIDYFLPENRLTNEMINQMHPEWSVDKISAKTGIYSRPIANQDVFASDLGIVAANKLFKKIEIDKNTIDFIMFCTQSPDYFLPTTACTIQDRLGLPKTAGAIDYNLGCSGFVYGLGLAKGMIMSGQAERILLITAETYSKYIHPKDKSNKTIFGDAGAAIIVSNKPIIELNGSVLDFVYYTDGSGFDKLIVRNGSIKHKNETGVDIFNEEGAFVRNDDNLYMDGKAIFEFTAFVIPPLIDQVLIKNNLKREDIDLYVFHQANDFMLQTVRKRCNIPEDKFFIHLKESGNTVSSTIPIALVEAEKLGRLKPGMKVLLAGFGVGLSAAFTILQY